MSYAVDIMIVLLIAANVATGWYFGVTSRAFAMAGLYGGVAMATFAGNSIENFFHGTGAPGDLYASAATYLGIVAFFVFMLEVLAFLYHDKVKKLFSLVFDRTAGALAGGLVGFLEVAVILLVMLAIGQSSTIPKEHLPADRTRSANAVTEAFFGNHVAGAEPFVRNVFRPVLPDNLSNHLGQATE